MGRMLEALKQPTGERVRPPEPSAETRSNSAPIAETPLPDSEDEAMSYIEVGGRQSEVEGSPDVMAMPTRALPRLQPQPAASVAIQAPPAPVTAPIKAPVEKLPVAGAWTVQFRPWGAEPRLAANRPVMSPELIAYHQPAHEVASQYRALLQGLLCQLPPGRGQVMLFTSPAPWGGTTTVLLNLAITAARQEGRRVAVVDANLRRPALAERLGVTPTPGLRDVLAGAVALPQALQESAQPNLRALAAGRSSGDLRLPLDWLLPTLRQLRDLFDLIFVDAPSWNEGSEVSALAATCDAVYMVLHQPGAQDPNAALPMLRQPPTNLQGCILTMR